MVKLSVIFIFLLIFILVPFTSSANDFAYNRLYENQQVIDGFNYSINVNNSNFALLANHSLTSDSLLTNIGSVGDFNTTQFNNIANVLNIDESWIDSLWCRLTGCTMTGDLQTNSKILISNSGSGIQRVINATSSNAGAVTSFGLDNDVGAGIVMATSGSGTGTFANDSGILCDSTGGRCFLANSGGGDIVLGHGELPTANFTWTLSSDGTVTQTGNLVMNGSKIFLDGLGDRFITINTQGFPFNGIATNATWTAHNNPKGSGSIVFLKTVENQTVTWSTALKNNSYSLLSGNSGGLVPGYMAEENFTENGIINMSKASDYIFLCNLFGVDCNFNADTRGNAIDLIPGGPLLFTMGDLEVWQSAKIHKGIAVEGPSVFDLEGNNANFNNGSVHIAIPVTFEQGFTAGDEVPKFTETFAGGLGIFVNLQADLGDWVNVLNSVLCDEGECAQGDGAGVGLVQMQTNFSTLDINETTLSFVYSLVNLIGSGDFSIEVNNNVGSGDIEIFSDTTDTVVKSSQVISLPSSMDNKSLVTLTFICNLGSAGKPTRQCYSDTVKINGTAITTTLINVSGFNSVIAFSDGALAADGFPERGIIYNASSDTTIIRGNATFENIIEQDLNVTNSITLNSSTIFDWADIVNTPLFPSYFLTNGSSVMQGNANFGGFDLQNVANANITSRLTLAELASDDGVLEILDSLLGSGNWETSQTMTATNYELSGGGTFKSQGNCLTNDGTPCNIFMATDGTVGFNGNEDPQNALDVFGVIKSNLNNTIINAISDVLILEHSLNTGSTPASGIGLGLNFRLRDLGGVEKQGGIDLFLENVTDGSEDAVMCFVLNVNGTLDNMMCLNGSSQTMEMNGTTIIAENINISGNIQGANITTDVINSISATGITVNDDLDLGAHKLTFGIVGTDNIEIFKDSFGVLKINTETGIRFTDDSAGKQMTWQPGFHMSSEDGDDLGQVSDPWGTLFSNTIDLGTNTIFDGNMTGDWNYNGATLSNVSVIDGGGSVITVNDDVNFGSNNINVSTLNVLAIESFLGSTQVFDELSMQTANINMNSGDLLEVGTIDFGTNTFFAGNMTGDWDINSGDLLEVGTIDFGTNTFFAGNMTGDWDVNSGDFTEMGRITFDEDGTEFIESRNRGLLDIVANDQINFFTETQMGFHVGTTPATMILASIGANTARFGPNAASDILDFGSSTRQFRDMWIEGDFHILADNKSLQIGATQTDLQISSDGTNPVYNSTGIHTFYNSTGLGSIRTGSIVFSSPENKDYSALDKLVNPMELTKEPTELSLSGKSELEFHQSFPLEVQKTIQIKDPDNFWDIWCLGEDCVTVNPKDENYTKGIEHGTKDELGIDGGDWIMFNYKAVYELKEENNLMKASLCKLGESQWC